MIELLELITGGFPSPLEHGVPDRHDPRRQAPRRPRPAPRRARWSPRWSRPRPTRTWAGSAWYGSSPARCAPTRRCTSRATAWPSGATRTTTSTSGSAPCPRPFGKTAAPPHAVRRGRPGVRGEAGAGRDRRHPVRQGRPAADGALGHARPAAPARDRGPQQGRRGQALAGPGRVWSPRTRPCGSSSNPSTHQLVLWCMGEAHRDVALERLRSRYGVAGRRRAAQGVAARDVRRARRPGAAGTSNSPAGTGSSRSARSRWSRCRRAAASSSSTRWSAGRCRASSSPPSRRAYGPRPRTGVAAGYPLVDVRVTLLTARRTRSTPPTRRSRPPGRSRCARRPPRPRIHLLEPVAEVQVMVADDYVGPVMSDLSGTPGPGGGHRTGGTGAHPGQGRDPRDRDRTLRPRPAVALARHRTVQPQTTRGTSRCHPSSPTRCAHRTKGSEGGQGREGAH